MARVTRARYSPRSRSAGTPSAKPRTKVMAAAIGMVAKYGMSQRSIAIAAV